MAERTRGSERFRDNLKDANYIDAHAIYVANSIHAVKTREAKLPPDKEEDTTERRGGRRNERKESWIHTPDITPYKE